MNTAENKCIWTDQCGENECELFCSHYYPIDGSVEEIEYEDSLRKNVELYQKEIWGDLNES